MNIKTLISTLAPIAELIDVIEKGPQGRMLDAQAVVNAPEKMEKEWPALWKAKSDNESLVCHGEVNITLGMLRSARFIHDILVKLGDEALPAYIRYKINPLVDVIDSLENQSNSYGKSWRSEEDDNSHWVRTSQVKLLGEGG